MSTSIDQRVVEMRFDNKQFESGVAETTSSLDKLKKSLNLSGASKGLEEVSSAAKNVDMSPLAKGVESVRLQFSALEMFGIKVLNNIMDTAINTGKRIVSALTIDPVKLGFKEYETQINAVQTILANTKSKGSTLEDVNSALDELNTYADKTIYNFTEMTRNIGTFTAAGVDLDTSVSAIKGIANLAAVSGSTSQQASTAMYQLSQALASGTVKLMDWNSVVNAGMGGQVFQDALKETARVHGVEIDKIIEKQGSFRESLSEGWLTSEILTETLSKFTGDLTEEQLKSMGYTDQQIKGIMELGETANDAATKVKTFSQLFDTLKEAAQSGWTQTWEIIIGDFEEAKEFLTQVSDVIGGIIGKSADSRNELLENWKVLGGRTALLDSIKNIFDALVGVITPVKEAFREIFPPMTAEKLVSFTNGLQDLTAKLKLSDDASNKLKRTFKGIFGIIKIVLDVATTVGKLGIRVVKGLLKAISPLVDCLFSVVAAIGDVFAGVSKLNTSGDLLNTIFDGMVSVVSKVAKTLAKFFNFVNEHLVFPGLNVLRSLFQAISGDMTGISETASNMKESISNALTTIGTAFKNSAFFGFLQKVWEVLKLIGRTVKDVFVGLFDAVFGKLKEGDLSGVLDILKAFFLGGSGYAIISFFKKLKEFLTTDSVFDGIKDVFNGVCGVLNQVKNVLAAYQQSIKAEILMKIAKAVLILVAALIVLSFIPEDRLAKGITSLALILGTLAICMKLYSSSIDGLLEGAGNAKVIKSFASSILILVAALWIISGIEEDRLTKGLVGLSVLMLVLTATLKLMGNQTTVINKNTQKVIKTTAKVLLFSAAMMVLAKVVKFLGELDWLTWGRGLGGVVICMAAMTACMVAMKNTSEAMSKTTKATSTVTEKNKSFAKVAGQMIGIAVAMIAMGAAIKIIGSMDWETWGKGLGGVVICMAAMTIAMRAMKTTSEYAAKTTKTTSSIDQKKFAKFSGQMIGMAVSMIVMGAALRIIGSMNWQDLAKGLTGVTVCMAAMILAMRAMNTSMEVALKTTKTTKSFSKSNIVKCASQMIGIATAMIIMGAAMKIIGSMDWETLGRSLTGLATAMSLMVVVMAVAGKVNAKGCLGFMAIAIALQMLIPVLFIFGTAFPIFVVGAAAIAASMLLIGGAALLFSKASTAIMAFGVAVLTIGAGLLLGGAGLKLFALGLTAIAIIFVPLCTAISAGLVILATGIVSSAAILVGSVSLLGKLIEELIGSVIAGALKGLGKGIISLCELIGDSASAISKAFVAIVYALCDAIGKSIPKIVSTLVQLAVEVIVAFLEEVPMLAESVLKVIVSLLDSLTTYAPLIVDKLFNMLVAVIGKLAERIPDLVTPLVDILLGLVKGVIQAFSDLGTDGLLEAFKGIGMLAAIMTALAAMAALAPAAMIGCIAMLAVVAELSLVLSAIGALAQIPGLTWIVGEGGKLLQAIGTAIGQFVGGLIGGIGKGISSSLPDIADNLSSFMDKLQPFLAGAILIDESVVNGVKNIVDVITSLTKANLLESITAFITGEGSIEKFANELPILGEGLREFSEETSGISAENVSAAAESIKILANVSESIPKIGGFAQLIGGTIDIGKFGQALPELGEGIKGFSDSVEGVVPENVKAATEAAKSLADMSNSIPKTEGVKQWWGGEQSVASFGDQLPALGRGLKGFSDAVDGINGESVTAAVNAAKTLSEMTQSLPDEGGVTRWFTGEKSIAKFSLELASLGAGLKGFSVAVTGINSEDVATAVNAAKSIAEMSEHIPNYDGIGWWFTGRQSISKFGNELIALGIGLKGFAVNVDGINPESVSAAATAAKSIAEMTSSIPKEGGIKGFFCGDVNLASFADKFPALGKGLKGMSDAVEGMSPENVKAAAEAAKNLGDMTSVIPTRFSNMIEFGKNLEEFGKHLKTYFDNTSGISAETISLADQAVKSINSIETNNAESINNLSESISKIVKSLNEIANVPENCASNFKKALNDIGSASVDSFVKEFENASSDMKTAGKKAINAFIEGVKSNQSSAVSDCKKLSEALTDNLISGLESSKSDMRKAGESVLSAFITGIKNKKSDAKDECKDLADGCKKKFDGIGSDFETIGKNVAKGFANGIEANTYLATAKAKAMAKAAKEAAKKELNENSPSKEFYEIGDFAGKGFIYALDDYASESYKAGAELASSAKTGLSDTISKIRDIINSDMDDQLTIRPVLDLSDIENGVGRIGNLLGFGSSVGVLSNVNSINSMMGRLNQNGPNDDVISAIDKLRNDINNMDHSTYNINGVTYDDGSNIASAVETLIRAARVERRI